MKFMKLGSKLDAFQSEGCNIRFVATELPTDVVVRIGEVIFYLHKFPLLSKSNLLQKLVLKGSEDNDAEEILLQDFPGGPKVFELCAKFCYGMTLTLNAYNVVAARCAAEFLEMTEDVEKGNLIHKIEVFLNSSVLRSWKDSIIALQTTQSLIPWSEELKIAGICIDCIAAKSSVDPASVSWSYTYSRKPTTCSDEIVESQEQQTAAAVPCDWWVEDVCGLDVDLYRQVMVAVKARGRMSSDLIGEALKAYAVRWLPDSYDALVADDYMKRNRVLVETVVSLLPPPGKCSGSSCRFLLKLLKVGILVGAGGRFKEELIERIGVQLHKASVRDLLIPVRSGGETMYDVHMVQGLVDKFMINAAGTSADCSFADRRRESRFLEIRPEKESLPALGKLIDGYLCEVSSDPNLSMSRFTDLAKSIPEAARPVHDGLYSAIDVYLKEHPNLTKDEKKRICGLMDVKKLSAEGSIHAAQNERLPLRVVVQVLFFEQLRAGGCTPAAPVEGGAGTLEEEREQEQGEWEGRVSEHRSSLKQQLRSLKIKVDECRIGDEKKSRRVKEKGGSLLPSRSRRIFDKLWAVKAQGETIKSSETSGSSQSPPITGKQGEAKSSGSSRHMRYSIS